MALCLNQARWLYVAMPLTVVLLVGLFVGGYMLGRSGSGAVDASVVASWRQQIAEQKQQVVDAKQQAQAYINALSLRVGELQAHVMRLDALGQRLTKMADLEKGEFDFDQPPAQGGPEDPADTAPEDTQSILQAMDQLSSRLDDREQQLSALETMLLHTNLQKQVYPTGRPVRGGWISSYFGMRADPFTGKREFHKGIDFAGKRGSKVMAVAAGVVTWAGSRYGYGNLVEIDHGNGYVTRYGHNMKVLVKVGERVKQGQPIALMGSTGRSTGPHVHFEVLHNGVAVNPAKYVRASR
jgi:murein DD-endopeptidase MepM/ murein hydrolase activator NlpD